MPGWLRHVSTRARLSGRSGKAPRMAKQLGKSRTVLKAISVELESQPGGWITAASTPPSSMRPTASSVVDGARAHVAGQAAAPKVDLSIHDAHHASPPSYLQARFGRRGPSPATACSA